MERESIGASHAASTAAASVVRRATVSDEPTVVDALLLAFAADPVMRWIWPDPQQYVSAWPRMVRTYGGQAFLHEGAHCLDGYLGAALWLPPGVHPDPDPVMALLQETVSEARQADLLAFFEQMGRFTPEAPYWYLPIIGVDPSHQGQGHGSALLRYGLRSADRDTLPAYLEASNTRNVALYERHGFKVIGTIQAGGSPTSYAMYRLAR